MAILSTFTIIRTISLFHITAAYFFLTAPQKLADQNVVFMLGESMRLPHATSLVKPSESSAFIGVVLAFLGISDLTAANMNEETGLQYWLAIVPARLTFLFSLTAYTYLFKEDGMFGSGPRQHGRIGENVQNSLVFSFGFFELAMWFWVFTSLREDRRRIVRKRVEQLKADEDRL
ncbi:Putative increased loss of mitochondrial DNA protein [Acrodontium crateriforme]|uniref:Increased loss of mitochondrial DNA protein n=1 Tax=Acrodontium crateriforme TaxID=150365 RepID=A0AAQ3M6J0_9PEZI|nr:Putative increased loss of mitochondrial DNA protein [Acrodontium crateriforme]